MPNWTKEQQAAIDARGSNLLVAAAAGSGKTAVLVERIIQIIIRDRVDIDRLLIVTFTNAAAGEMRERIGAALLDAVEAKDENEQHLRRQISLLGKASISTLHSFCISVLRRYFHVINIDPNFRIGDETETSILKMEVMENLFEEEYEKGNDVFLGLVERFGGNRQDIPLQELVLQIHTFIQSKPYPGEWLAERVEDFRLDKDHFMNSPWYSTILEQIRMELSGALEYLQEAKELCRKPYGPAAYMEMIEDDSAQVEELLGALDSPGGLSAFFPLLTGIKHKRLGRCSKEVDEEQKAQVQALRDMAKTIIKDIRDHLLRKSPEEYIRDINELYPYMKYLYQLVMAFHDAFQAEKSDKGILDFNDLEHYTLAVLEKEEVSCEFKDKYEYIFVDEYQDSNIVQETILNFIKRDGNLFLVGDIKQSIYRFRLADPTLFIDKYYGFDTEEGKENRRIDLNKNFRSRMQILDGVNYIFRNIMSVFLGEMDYDEKAALYKGLEMEEIEDPSIEVHLIEKDAVVESMDPELDEMDDMTVEARITAQRIKELLGSKIYDGKRKEYREVDFRDIVILLRSTRNWAPIFLDTFTAEGIPAYADVNAGYFEVLEVQIFMNLLKIIDNKRQDIPLISVMRSTIGGFTAEDLIDIRISSMEKTFYQGIEKYMEKHNDALKGRLCSFISRLDEWKKESRYMNIDDFIWKLFMDTGYYYYVGSMPGGMERQANLRILFDRARQFQQTSIKGLFNFIRFIDKLKSSSGDMGTAKTLGENDNVVRIMSIHKSKGLEFPVVIAAGMGKQYNLMDTNAPVLLHKELGVGPRYVDPDIRQTTDTIAKIAMRNKIKIESLSEEMRILYVAFTRPKDKLIVVGSVRDMRKTIERWAGKITPLALSKAKTYLDWVGPLLLRHKNGEKLREIIQFDSPPNFILEDPSKWTIELHNRSHIVQQNVEKAEDQKELLSLLENYDVEAASEVAPLLEERFSWKYRHSAAARIPSKLSVTEIKKIHVKDLDSITVNTPSLIERPKFMEGRKTLSAAERGSVIHFVMQHLDLAKVGSRQEIDGQIQEMVEKELLKREEADIVDLQKLLHFFDSPIGCRILQAREVYREVPFNLVQKACDVIPELPECEEKLLIQGVIDCYFMEDDEWVLVDYKTDFVTAGTRQDVVDQYRIQVNLYSQALEKITGIRVKERVLYLFYLNEGIPL